MSVSAASPQALSTAATATPAWKNPSCWVSPGAKGTRISTRPGSTRSSTAWKVLIRPCRAKLPRTRRSKSGSGGCGRAGTVGGYDATGWSDRRLRPGADAGTIGVCTASSARPSSGSTWSAGVAAPRRRGCSGGRSGCVPTTCRCWTRCTGRRPPATRCGCGCRRRSAEGPTCSPCWRGRRGRRRIRGRCWSSCPPRPSARWTGCCDSSATDVFDWLTGPAPEEAVVPAGQGTLALVSDAVVAGYAAGQLAPADRRTLIGPWLAAVRRLGDRPVDFGPRDATIHGLLARLARATPRDRARLGLACDALRTGPQPWASAMHRATWVAHLTDRVRAGAAGQLGAVAALQAGGLTPTECAAGTWNAVSAAVAALTVADLVGDEELGTLLDPVATALEIRLP